MRGEGSATATTPRHRAITNIEPTFLIASFEEVPDVLNVSVAKSVVRVVKVIPLTQTLGLLINYFGIFFYAFTAGTGKFVQAECPNLFFGIEAQIFFYLYFYPEPLAVKAILPTLIKTLHGLVALEDVLERAAPSMMDTHGVIGRDWSI